MTEYQIDPDTETPIPGTQLTVQHGGDEEGYVHVEEDGTIRLGGPWDWTLRTLPAVTDKQIWSYWDSNIRPGLLASGTPDYGIRHLRGHYLADVRANPEALRQVAAEPAEPTYLIWSNHVGLWWRPKAAGYTPEVIRAGRYSYTDAQRFCGAPIWEPGVRVPRDVIVPAPAGLPEPSPDGDQVKETLRDHIHEANRAAIKARKATGDE